MVSSSGWNQVISLLPAGTWRCPSTVAVSWVIAASRCTPAPPVRAKVPRRDLPSTAIAAGVVSAGSLLLVVVWLVSQLLITSSRTSPSSRVATRRTVASLGATCRAWRGSNRAPRAASTGWGASAAHSPIAVNDCAPAATAAAASARIDPIECRTPRRSRGSGTTVRCLRRSAAQYGSVAALTTGARRSITTGIRHDCAAGTALSHDHGT